MSELPPQPEQPHQFSSPRDEVLYQMGQNGWAFESNGDRTADTGWFCWLKNEIEEIPDVVDTFEADIQEAGLERHHELVGSFLVRENRDGLVTVTEFDMSQEAKAAYDELDSAFRQTQEGGS